jgi:hypothetical protein
VYATVLPSRLIVGFAPGPPTYGHMTVMRRVVFAARSRTKTSVPSGPGPLVSSGTRFVAREMNATYRPSALIVGTSLNELARTSASLTLTSSVMPRTRSRTAIPCGGSAGCGYSNAT